MPVLSELYFYPIKSCAGIALREATLTAAGLMSGDVHDREWMVVDTDGVFMSQRTCPRMALITPQISDGILELHAPGLTPLSIALDLAASTAPMIRVQVWDDVVDAQNCDTATANWLSTALGLPCRLVRFPPSARRLASMRWTQGKEAPTRFADAFPLLIISQAALDDLNQKLIAQQRAALPMNRFRPNLVLADTGAFDEDYAATISIGDALLKPVKPCVRCNIPSVDQATAIIGADPLDILQTYRANPLMDGGITFGMNAMVLAGEGSLLTVGQPVEIEFDF